jgi:hypothetical protein
MKRILLIGLAVCLMWLTQPPAAFASWINSEESALTNYLDALKSNHLDRAAEIDCWGYKPKKLLGLKSWTIKPKEENGWEASIALADDRATQMVFQVVDSDAYRLTVDLALDKTVNRLAGAVNRLGRAVGFDLKDPDPINPEDIGIHPKERFCIMSHFSENAA